MVLYIDHNGVRGSRISASHMRRGKIPSLASLMCIYYNVFKVLLTYTLLPVSSLIFRFSSLASLIKQTKSNR